ncbi:MAG: protein kinase [Pseudomonadota bacterium]
MTPPPLLSPGQVIGQHRVERLLGRGGIAEVYLVTELTFEVPQALKVMLDDDEDRARRLIREGRAQYLVQHPNVVRVLGSLTVLGRHALIMEYVEGVDLRRWLHGKRLRGLWPSREVALELFRGVLDGVGAAHARGLVHRDLKPANILVAPTAGGVVPKVTDFGLVKDLLQALTPGEGTVAGTIMGTQGYIAPEQIWALPEIDARADVYSLGCLLYLLVCGQPAFGQDDLSATFSKVLGEEYTDPRAHVPDLPEGLWLALRHSLVADRRHRIPSCETLWDVIQRGRPALAALGLRGAAPPTTTAGPQETPAPAEQAAGEVTATRRLAADVATVAMPVELIEHLVPETPAEPEARGPTTRRLPPPEATRPPTTSTLRLPESQVTVADPVALPPPSQPPGARTALPASLPDGVVAPPRPRRTPRDPENPSGTRLGRPTLWALGSLLLGIGMIAGAGVGLVIARPGRQEPAPAPPAAQARAPAAPLHPSAAPPAAPPALTEVLPAEPGATAPTPANAVDPGSPAPLRSTPRATQGPREPPRLAAEPAESAPPTQLPVAALAAEPPAASPVPAEPPMGRVKVEGTAQQVCLRSHADGQEYCAARVPAGAYDVQIHMGGEAITAGTTEIREGTVTSVRCDEAFLTCY